MKKNMFASFIRLLLINIKSNILDQLLKNTIAYNKFFKCEKATFYYLLSVMITKFTIIIFKSFL